VNKGEFDAMLSTISKEIRSKFTKSWLVWRVPVACP